MYIYVTDLHATNIYLPETSLGKDIIWLWKTVEALKPQSENKEVWVI